MNTLPLGVALRWARGTGSLAWCPGCRVACTCRPLAAWPRTLAGAGQGAFVASSLGLPKDDCQAWLPVGSASDPESPSWSFSLGTRNGYTMIPCVRGHSPCLVARPLHPFPAAGGSCILTRHHLPPSTSSVSLHAEYVTGQRWPVGGGAGPGTSSSDSLQLLCCVVRGQSLVQGTRIAPECHAFKIFHGHL